MNNIYNNVKNKTSVPINWQSQSTVMGTGAIGSSGTYTISNSTGYQFSPTVNITNDPSSLTVNGKIMHNGRDLEERLSIIEKVLMIPERDVELEKKYPKLKKLYNQYINELSKYRMWEELKGENHVG